MEYFDVYAELDFNREMTSKTWLDSIPLPVRSRLEVPLTTRDRFISTTSLPVEEPKPGVVYRVRHSSRGEWRQEDGGSTAILTGIHPINCETQQLWPIHFATLDDALDGFHVDAGIHTAVLMHLLQMKVVCPQHRLHVFAAVSLTAVCLQLFVLCAKAVVSFVPPPKDFGPLFIVVYFDEYVILRHGRQVCWVECS